MKLKQFDELTKKILAPVVQEEAGFSFDEGTFFRDFPNGVRHVLTLDFDTRKGSTFRVMVGANSPLLHDNVSPSQAGAVGLLYLSEGGLHKSIKNFVCFDEASATKSLETVKRLFASKVVPHFAAIDSIEKVADIAEEDYPFIKGKLYFEAGLRDRAKPQLEKHIEYLRKQPQVPAVVSGMNETVLMLQQC
jgi:hypothetical protein